MRKEWEGRLNSQQDLIDLIVQKYRKERQPGGKFEKLQQDIEELFVFMGKEMFGLYNARKIVELLGWDLAMESFWDISCVLVSRAIQRQKMEGK